MMTLHLGVVDIPYSGKVAATTADHFAALQRGKPLTKSSARGSLTTFDVATILEARYGIMQHFFNRYRDQIFGALHNSIEGKLETAIMGGKLSPGSTEPQLTKVETMFHEFISQRIVEQVGIKGVPTQAALDGVNHRLKHPYASTNPRRPSFRDTGLFMNNFAAWVSDETG